MTEEVHQTSKISHMTPSRRVLLAAGASLFSSFAGCSSVFTQTSEPSAERPPPLLRIEAKNTFEEVKEMELVVERDGEIVHWGNHGIRPANPRPEENYLGWVEEIKEPWMGCGAYEVSIRVSGTDLHRTIDFRELEPSPSIDGKFQPVILRIEFSPEGITTNTTRMDDPLLGCSGEPTSGRSERIRW